ncbi:MAG: hypothetical protein II205_02035 [Bacteroidales bacterium]|nr:hypothetical protein [Bacteroidales bacterium]
MKASAIYLGFALLMAVIAGASLSCAYRLHSKPPIVQTDTLTIHDTTRILEPIEVAYIPKGYELTPVGLVSELQNQVGELVMIVDSLDQRKPTIIVRDSLVFVQVPMEQKIYQGEGYKAAVSGYKPTLDWIETYNTTKTITPQPKKWGISISAGYGMTPQGFAPTLMIGVSRDIVQW